MTTESIKEYEVYKLDGFDRPEQVKIIKASTARQAVKLWIDWWDDNYVPDSLTDNSEFIVYVKEIGPNGDKIYLFTIYPIQRIEYHIQGNN